MPDLPPGVGFGLAHECRRWIRQRFGEELLPWQWMVLRYALATVPGRGGEPRPLFTRVVVRVARQQGKTFLARRLMAWRLLEGERWFGQPQRLINTHPDGAQAVGLLEPVARRFGYARGGLPGYTRQVFMASWHPGGRDSETEAAWYARAMTTHALTGNQGITFAYVDELQDARAQVVSEALGGSLSGSRVQSRQRWFTGTGEKPHSELLRRLRRSLYAPGMCWVEWSAPPGTGVRDRDGWRWASPDWSEGREAYLSEQLDELGDTEFAANYLLSDEALTAGPALVDPLVWDGLQVDAPTSVVWVSAAVEAARFGAPVVVLAARLPDGRALVSARRCPDTAAAAAVCLAAGVPTVLVGKSLLADPVWAGLVVEPRQGTDQQAAGDLRRLVDDDQLCHDGDGVLAAQVASEVVTGMDGVERVSRGGLDAVKAAVWAAHAARTFEPWFAF